MSMMIHRNKKRKAEKSAALAQNAKTPDEYKEKTPEEQRYTRTEINHMNKADLKEMAINVGIEGADDMTGTELKERLLELFGL